jgi:hypothetical protein
MLLFEFRRIVNLDRPYAPVGEGGMDLFLRTATFLYIKYGRVLF